MIQAKEKRNEQRKVKKIIELVKFELVEIILIIHTQICSHVSMNDYFYSLEKENLNQCLNEFNFFSNFNIDRAKLRSKNYNLK